MSSASTAGLKNRTRHSSLFASAQRRHTHSQKLSRAATALGVIGGLFALWSVTFGGHDPQPASQQADVAVLSQSSLVESFAVDFVAAYLNSSTSDSDAMTRYLTAEKYYLPSVRAEASDPRAVYVKQVANRGAVTLWNVIVSVRQPAEQNLTNSPSAATPRSFYAVPISLANGSARALLLPRRVDAPRPGVDVALNYRYRADSTTAFGDLARSFLNAYLVSPQDLARFITAKASIVAPTPSPYSDITVEEVRADTDNQGPADGSRAHLLVTITARTLSYTKTGLTYPLTVVAAGGHWQVEEISPIPELGTGTDTPEPTTTSTSTAPSGVPEPTRSNN